MRIETDALIKPAAEDIAAAKLVTALTGAGISTESGIPPFRGKGGLWERFDLMLVLGTSAEVQPAAMMPVMAKDSGATIIEINPQSTLLTGTVSD
jgi:NAD-dependent deacetylase